MPNMKVSRSPYAETIARLSAAIVAAGNTIFATIDQTAAAKTAGLTLRPTTLLVFGNPKAGTLLMEANPIVGLELPLKFIIWDDAAVVRVGYATMADLTARYGLGGKEALLAAMDRALDTLSNSIS